jgi:hypothetical protein
MNDKIEKIMKEQEGLLKLISERIEKLENEEKIIITEELKKSLFVFSKAIENLTNPKDEFDRFLLQIYLAGYLHGKFVELLKLKGVKEVE